MNNIDVPIDSKPTTWTHNDFLACAHHLGYDPNKLQFDVMPDIMKETIAGLVGSDGEAGMVTDMTNGNIYVFPKNIPAGFERGVMAHEIFHVAYMHTVEAYCAQRESGGPLVERFKDTFGSPKNLGDVSWVSNYAAFYMEGAMTNKPGFNLGTCVTEVLSEMARVYEVTGTLPNTKIWQKLYRGVQNTAIELGVIKR